MRHRKIILRKVGAAIYETRDADAAGARFGVAGNPEVRAFIPNVRFGKVSR
jgi:hypothetical protein